MAKYTEREILEMIEDEDVKFIRLQFVDLFGMLKNIAVTAGQMEKALAGRCRVEGFHITGMNELGHRQIFLKPDLDTFAILPWRPQQGKVARFLCDLTDRQGNLLKDSPRYILRRVLEDAKQDGYHIDLYPECEFFLFQTDEEGKPTTETGEMAGYLDVAPLDGGENARRDMILTLEEMGFEIKSSHHENAPAQHEVDFKPSRGVKVADQVVTFRSTVRTVAQRHGLHATFMPKPRTDLPGSAMSLNIAVFRDGKNIFTDLEAPDRMSQEAHGFIAGLLEHMNGITAISNPVVNSYKRMKARFYAPTERFWSVEDYHAPILVTEGENREICVEWKLPDGAANPYLTIAAAVVAGLDGMRQKKEVLPVEEKAGALPGTLKEAVAAFAEDSFLRNAVGQNYASMYIHEKQKEWERYAKEVTDWEMREYLHKF